jgi:hypothetical protein
MSLLHKVLLSIACISLMTAGNAVADSGEDGDPDSVPARLPAEFETALNESSFPEFARSEELTLYCVSDITGKGRPRNNTCLPHPDFVADKLREKVVELIRDFRLSPAQLDGKRVATEFYYRVHLDTSGSVPRIRVYPNWGHSSDLHGQAYDAPQRYEPRRFPPGCIFIVAVAVTPLDANGKVAGDTEVSTPFPPQEATLECIEQIETRHRISRYIPAQLEGNAVAAIHVEVWGDPEKYTLDVIADASVQ